VAAESFSELGLVGLIVAGAAGDGSVWVTARGWASLDQDDVLLPAHRFPAYSITKLITATAVLRLVADGPVRLDEPANAYLHTVRLADDAVTVRQLLSHTGGVDSPASMFADRVPDLVSVTGPVAACGGPRGSFSYGLAWSSLLPDALAREALRPQAERDDVGGQAGLGWMLMLPKYVAGHPGAGSGFSASLIVRPGLVGPGGRTWVVLTNRRVLVEPVNERLALPIRSTE
jgi:hypothetical protein